MHTIEEGELANSIQVRTFYQMKGIEWQKGEIKEEWIRHVGNSVTRSNIELTEVPEGEKENNIGTIEKKMTENFSKPMKQINLWI